ncbi:peptidyl-tRNA hydrolase [Corynebacterium sp.]|uniref:peptidyl-tRNA hydrolase n=1 Tax=Corynebacterium sp. TaxID=1720 RepID=UPI002A919D52|nr:peptidyl-tRNA hydrolase [Corynebacterium sp.]MDY5785809.1 peptidyl-tRNA hydrolase [Corynebacterium sp.]
MSDAFARAHELLVDRMTHDNPECVENPADPATVQAMQLAVNVPKNAVPSRNAVLCDAASAVVAVCLDPRAGEDGFWRASLDRWYSYRIRKIARRARNKAWDDVQGLPGVTVGQVRAFVPSAVEDVPREIAKLQVKGTDFPDSGEEDLNAAVPTLYLNADLQMSGGKAAAQAGHGSMLLAAALGVDAVRAWAELDFGVNVREVGAAELARVETMPGAVAVRDAGFTEVAPNSLTVVALPASV